MFKDLSIKSRVLLLTLLPSTLLACVLGGYFSWTQLSDLRQQIEARGALISEQLAVLAAPALQAGQSGRLQRIAEAVNGLADQRQSLQEDVESRIREARLSVEEERNRLAALMSELNQSVVVCNLDGRILLYNSRARLQFKALSDAPSAAGGGEIIGLGRSIYLVFERNLIVHALESIQERIRRQSSRPLANFVTTTRAGQLLRVLFLDREGHISAQPHYVPREQALILASNQQRVLGPQAEVRVL